MGLEFHETVMGHRFFEGQLPQMIKGIEKNNSSIEKLTALLEKQCALLEEQNALLKNLQKSELQQPVPINAKTGKPVPAVFQEMKRYIKEAESVCNTMWHAEQDNAERVVITGLKQQLSQAINALMNNYDEAPAVAVEAMDKTKHYTEEFVKKYYGQCPDWLITWCNDYSKARERFDSTWIGEKGGLKYWSNCAGDLFIPGSAWNDTIEEKDLPPELQYAYENLWTDNCGSYCYLVELDGMYGIALINEYDTETGFSKEEIEGRAAEAKKMLTAENIPFMKVFCAEYSEGDEMAVVLPWDVPPKSFNRIADFLYSTAYKKDATYEDYKVESKSDTAYPKEQEMEDR